MRTFVIVNEDGRPIEIVQTDFSWDYVRDYARARHEGIKYLIFDDIPFTTIQKIPEPGTKIGEARIR